MQMSYRNRGGMGSLSGSSSLDISGIGPLSSDTGADMVPVLPTTLNPDTGNSVNALTNADLQNGAAAQAADANLTTGSNSPINEATGAASSYAPAASLSTLFSNLFGTSKTATGGATAPASVITIGGVAMSPLIMILLGGGVLYLLSRSKK
jgi:hypothetical protein